ncbi:tripartite tricarboxylate transporter substrate binding protein [Xylophilus sp. GOD-11R]|uniref:Bug family tripartite tricarboxylate transporter substrate binding protein n=1 Tax=Xylophilus sp. GOD-11R TaxID=3089814 RepID=UPI00298C50C8|nr:tripartite tricarboxylate transporter substrate binding protein [Xylophilus sp. GOD-11R]WPB56881.1 tripartite tricarboxylate transporter substrate binding protein [Xylophilus sp. GOD-11R]
MPLPTLRSSVLCALAAALVTAVAPAGAESAFPGQPIRLVVPFPPAGGTDVLTRLVMNDVTQATQWNFVIDNRPGAGGNIGLDMVAKAKADGYTLGTGQTANLAINPSLYSKLPFDPLKDFAPVALLATQPVVIVVRADSPLKTVADLKARAAGQPLNMASPGTGTVGHIAGEMFARRAGIQMTHVPYKGAGPAITDLIGGVTDLYIATPPSVIPMIKGGKLRALAVTSAQRIAALPDVPTVAESGYAGFVAEDWKALVAPAGTPDVVVQQINTAVNTALKKPALIARMQEEGTTVRGGTPAELGALIKSETPRWGAAVKASGAKAD